MANEPIPRTISADEGVLAPADEGPALVVLEGTSRGARARLEGSDVSIGRLDENDLVLDSALVSQRHARAGGEGGSFWIEDLHSTNGVLVNGRRLRAGEPHALSHGDVIVVSDHLLLFMSRGAFTDRSGLSTISVDVERARREADDLLADLPGLRSQRGRHGAGAE